MEQRDPRMQVSFLMAEENYGRYISDPAFRLSSPPSNPAFYNPLSTIPSTLAYGVLKRCDLSASTTTTTDTLLPAITNIGKKDKGEKGKSGAIPKNSMSTSDDNNIHNNTTGTYTTVWHVVEGGAPKPQKKRRRFDDKQLRLLEEAFQESPFVAESRKNTLAYALQVSPKQVQHW